MKRIAVVLFPLLMAATCTGGFGGEAALHDAAATITAADAYERIAFLASDRLRGRDTPSPGLDTAAQWIADELASFGVEPAGEAGWFQRYPYPAIGIDPGAAELLVAGGATHRFTFGADFYARPGAAPDGAVGVTYAGRSLEADGTELADRAVMVHLLGLPEQGRTGQRLDRQARAQVYRTLARAEDAAARAVIFVLDAQMTREEFSALAESAAAPSRQVGASNPEGLPAFFVSYEAGLRMFRMADLDGASILARRELDRALPLPGVTVRMTAPSRVMDDARPPNVVGVIRGSDPELRDEYVVMTAHMDHVGVGRPDETGDSIYNGADDDASGTALLVEVAEALAGLEPKPLRSVLFVAVSGEEKGLLGSRWFVEHPTVPLESMVANVNLDMVGRNAPDSIVVIGQEYSSLGPLVRRIAADNPELGLTVSEDLWPEQRFFFRSDHFNFAAKEIPALFFFAGTHEDYHRPGDEVDEVDTDKVARVGRLVFYLTHAIADARTPPEWNPEGLETVRQLTRR